MQRFIIFIKESQDREVDHDDRGNILGDHIFQVEDIVVDNLTKHETKCALHNLVRQLNIVIIVPSSFDIEERNVHS